MSTIYLNFEGRTLEEVRQKIRECGILQEEPTLIMPTLDPEHVAQALTQPEEQQPEVTQPDVKPDAPADPTIKLEDVRAAANAYRDKHGIEALREIFKMFGGEKLKDIPAANYAALMKEIV
jgi:hypothetical protein